MVPFRYLYAEPYRIGFKVLTSRLVADLYSISLNFKRDAVLDQDRQIIAKSN